MRGAAGHCRRAAGLAAAGLVTVAATARAAPDEVHPYLAPERPLRTSGFWWPAVVFERASTHLTGPRSVDETRVGLTLAYRTRTLSPHLRLLLSPSLERYQDLAALAGAGLRVFFDVGGVPLSYGTGVSVEARLRDSVWLAYAAPLEIGAPIYRGSSAEHYLFVGARRCLASSLINSYLLDPNGYDNENSLAELDDLRSSWQLYISLVFGRRVE